MSSEHARHPDRTVAPSLIVLTSIFLEPSHAELSVNPDGRPGHMEQRGGHPAAHAFLGEARTELVDEQAAHQEDDS